MRVIIKDVSKKDNLTKFGRIIPKVPTEIDIVQFFGTKRQESEILARLKDDFEVELKEITVQEDTKTEEKAENGPIPEKKTRKKGQ